MSGSDPRTTLSTPPTAARARPRSDLRGLRTLVAAATVALIAWWHASAHAQNTVTPAVLVDGTTVDATFGSGGAADLASGERLAVTFAAGSAEVRVDDVGVWDFAHVMAVSVRRQADGSYRFDTTVRHRDEGWDHYADLWRVVGNDVENGERVLLHPHDDEQPFTRSQSNVVATGVVTIEARDSVHGFGGSTITIDLDAMTADSLTIELDLDPQP